MNSDLIPKYVTDLVDIYGTPSQEGFGSAVFYEKIGKKTDLEQIARQYYQYFVGDLWTRFGETAWLSGWKEVYIRKIGEKSDIVAELKAITFQNAAQFVPIILLNDTEQSEKAHKTLSNAYDDANMSDLRVYTIGDGGAMAGLLIIGYRTTGEVTVLISLLN